MSREPKNQSSSHPDRRDFLKTAGGAAAGALLLPRLELVAATPGMAESAEAALAGWRVRPFALSQVKLTESLFTQKRDRILHYARGYGSESDVFAGPDRVLSIFRANAGLDTKGADPVGSWENGTGYLRGHYAGHFMTFGSAQAAGCPGAGGGVCLFPRWRAQSAVNWQLGPFDASWRMRYVGRFRMGSPSPSQDVFPAGTCY